MQKELNMNAKNNAYTTVSLVFFITYTIFQAPATILIRNIGPRLFLSAIVLFWGATMIVSQLPLAIGSQLIIPTGLWIRAELASHGRPPRYSWHARSWILSWMCLPAQHLVP